MKIIKAFILVIVLSNLICCNNIQKKAEIKVLDKESVREYYQIKTIIFNTDEQVAQTDAYLKEAYLPALKKIGLKNIGVFKPIPNPNDTLKRTIMIIPFNSMEQFLKIDEKLNADETYKRNGKDYLEVGHDQPAFNRYESVLLKAFTDMPFMKTPDLKGPRNERVYELRSYESPSDAYYKNKLDMFNAGGEIKLFDQLVFNAVFYGDVVSGSKMPNLMYMTTFENMESRDEHWKQFVDSPEWNEMKAMSKYKNNVSHADIYLLYPTAYSDY